jgi:hypothetical protein
MNITTIDTTSTTAPGERDAAHGSYTSRPSAQTAPRHGAEAVMSTDSPMTGDGVTDNRTALLASSSIRNGDDARRERERLEALAATAGDVTDTEERGPGMFSTRNETLGPWDDFRHPVTGRWYRDRARCFQCQRRFDDAETIYIAKRPMEPRHPVWHPYPHCEGCAGSLGRRSFSAPVPCAFCARTIRIASNWRCSRPVCCDLCASRAINRLAKAARAERRAKLICISCGQPFTPKRAGAKHCSSRCRQKAYRQRKAGSP